MQVALTVVPGGRISQAAPSKDADSSPDRIAHLAKDLSAKMQETVDEINHVNMTTRLLAMNAKIEAARAGAMGAAFSVVAGEIGVLSERTMLSTKKMIGETQDAVGELEKISETLATRVRGTRLSDLALTNIDLIDRNLYERSCDVRWWATDSSAVDALSREDEAAFSHASARFRQILASYTVYFDLVLCDLQGNVVANGRPDRYKSRGMNCSGAEWFKSAVATRSGEEFGFESVHASPLVGGQRILAYSCCVRRDGKPDGRPLGVLGILFNWDALAQTIVTSVPLSDSEKESTRVCIVDRSGTILADTENQHMARLDLLTPDILSSGKNAVIKPVQGTDCLIAHADAPGYETYTTGWHSIIIQKR